MKEGKGKIIGPFATIMGKYAQDEPKQGNTGLI